MSSGSGNFHERLARSYTAVVAYRSMRSACSSVRPSPR